MHLLTIVHSVTGRMPRVLPITRQDITPYGNELYHISSILQPVVATHALLPPLASGSPAPAAAARVVSPARSGCYS